MNPKNTAQPDDMRDPDPDQPVADPALPEPRPTTQAERAVMHPAYDDPDWRYFFGALHG